MEVLVVELHHRGSKMVYHTPVLQQQHILFSCKNNSLFLRKFLTQCYETDRLFGIQMGFGCVPLRQLSDLDSLASKSKQISPHSLSQSA